MKVAYAWISRSLFKDGRVFFYVFMYLGEIYGRWARYITLIAT
ncbi:Hypothetical protein BFG00_1010 [Corynebacterium pseudotuberculosis]|nr:Hypothetical protein BFF96_1014 [Corynebacterium pseudotuberculosis]AUY60397.1 Hypothetical protein BFG00_1010 [Corynebacterium pseudotuberculosis]